MLRIIATVGLSTAITMKDVLQGITTVGFPIAMCLIMALYIREIEIRHSNEVNSLKDALNNNTLALQHLADLTKKEDNENDN